MMRPADIVDTQIHIGPGGIEETLAQMDALGIRAALIDEYWFTGTANQPHHVLAGGVQRPVAPTAELAATAASGAVFLPAASRASTIRNMPASSARCAMRLPRGRCASIRACRAN